MLSQLLASSGWVLDLVFFLILVLGTALGAYRGFVAGICRMAGKVASVIFALLFCVSFANFLEYCFHLTTAITTGIAASIAKNGAYGVGLLADVPGAEISDALAQIGIGAFPRWFISLSIKSGEIIPAGTTAAMLIGSVLAKWITIAISFILLIILIRLAVFFLSKVFDSVIDKFAPLRIVNQFLGAILGFVKAFILIFVILTIFNWLPIASFHAYIQSSGLVGKIFVSNWFQNATSYAISGEWLEKLLNK